MQTTREILIGCKNNDRQAQRALYELLNKKLMGLSIRYTRSREDAKDVFQESFIKIYKSVGGIQKEASLEGWAKRIVINTAINHYNKNKKHQECLYVDEIERSTDHMDDDDIDHLSDEQLLEMINSLPEGSKLVFNLYIIEGYSHKEISEILDISVGTSKSQLNRAKTLLKQMLEKLGINEYMSYGSR